MIYSYTYHEIPVHINKKKLIKVFVDSGIKYTYTLKLNKQTNNLNILKKIKPNKNDSFNKCDSNMESNPSKVVPS